MKNLSILFISALISMPVSAQAPDEADAWFEHAFGQQTSDEGGHGGDIAVPELFAPEGYEYVNTLTDSLPYRKGKSNIILVGAPGEVRAMQPFSWSNESVKRYADVANLYASHFGPDVRVYCMPIPLASAYYAPSAASQITRPQHDAIKKMFTYLDDDVTGVDVYPILGEHAAEPIYSRTDHHWAPLGAYYAASQLAAAAGVPFLTLDNYDEHVVPDYVGTMYKFSGDVSVKNSPEDFVYYTPRDVEYKTTYITYGTRGLNVTSESEPKEGKFFLPFKGVSTYCTFMGGDSKVTKVETDAGVPRRLLILKDSFGNAIPGYLFASFEQIHVVDCRYFTKNLTDYVHDNGITDIVFCNNLGHATVERTTSTLAKYLNQ